MEQATAQTTCPAAARARAFRHGTLFLGLIALSAFVTGVRGIDQDITLVFQAYAGAIGVHDIPPDRQFLLDNTIPNLFGALLHITGLPPQHVRAIWIATPLILLLAFALHLARSDQDALRTLVIAVFLTGVTKVALSWIGKSDLYLVLAFALLVLARGGRWAGVAGATFAALCHPPIALLGVLSLSAARMACGERFDPRPLLGCVLGYAASLLVARLLFGAHLDRVSFISLLSLETVLRSVLEMAGFVVVSLGATSLFLLLAGRERIMVLWQGRAARVTACMLAAFGIPLLIALFLALDHSRVFVLATLPATLALVQRFGPDILRFYDQRPVEAILLSLVIAVSPQMEGDGWYLLAPGFVEALAAKLRSLS